MRGGARRAAGVGKPIAHSLSPVLHGAAFAALGLDWTYERIEADEDELPGLVAGLGPEWVGLSVTMPAKLAALELAAERTDRAVRVGSANTLVRRESGWLADCTDVDGAAGLLDEAGAVGVTALVVGAGGTSLPVIAALADRGFTEVTVVSRSEQRAARSVACGESFGMRARWVELIPAAIPDADAVVSTIPASGLDEALVARVAAAAPSVADVIYDPWPTPLIAAARAGGARTGGGLTMLLNQAFAQAEWFTGSPAPREAMTEALDRYRFAVR
jgi:shikimate dehydrogenase